MLGERFNVFTKPNKFSRVDSTHILDLFIGLDEKGRKSIELRDKFTYTKVTSSGAIEVNQYRKEAYNTIRFSLTNIEVIGLFYKFCEDLIEFSRTLSKKNEGYQAIIDRYYQWKRLFTLGNNKLLSEAEIMGLIGEILFLNRYLSPKVGLSNALASWSGQNLTHKDFSFQDKWYEVKAISSGKNEVKISSLEQLYSDKYGELVVFSLEKMSEIYQGVTLNDLILKTANSFKTLWEKEEFFNKIESQGYRYNIHYDSFVFDINSMKRYLVSENFPVLTKENVPKEVVKVSYSLDLSQLENYIIKE